MRGEPRISQPPPVVQSVLPASWLRASAAGLTPIPPRLPKPRARRRIEGVASLQEAMVNTTPYDGFDGSIRLPDGRGRLHDFVGPAAPRGLCRQTRTSTHIERRPRRGGDRGPARSQGALQR